MVAIYVLKLVRGKYYVGLTRRNIDRILDHLDGDGASWTRKYPPVQKKPIVSFQEGLRESDEDKITLQMMAKHGIENVRGGRWYRVKLSDKAIRDIQSRLKPNTKGSTKGTTTRRRKSKSHQCGRCGREGHNRTQCYASSTVDGVTITTESWVFRPKKSSKKSKSRRKRCMAKTEYGFGPRCSLTASVGSKYCHVHGTRTRF